MGFLSKEIRLESTIKPLATGLVSKVTPKQMGLFFPGLLMIMELLSRDSLRNIQQRESLTNCWCAACWEQLL